MSIPEHRSLLGLFVVTALVMPRLIGVGIGLHVMIDHGHQNLGAAAAAPEIALHGHSHHGQAPDHHHRSAPGSALEIALHGHSHQGEAPDHDHSVLVQNVQLVFRVRAAAASVPSSPLLQPAALEFYALGQIAPSSSIPPILPDLGTSLRI
jgi:hypothetical protein